MMEETPIVATSDDEWPKERLAPLGAAASSFENESGIFNETSRLQLLEQEQEQLNASLMALTTHFAKVQFRLKQIVSAPEEDKDKLLQELEEFAFRGCPNLDKTNQIIDKSKSCYQGDIIDEQQIRQKDLIDQLKNQLQDLESYAYESAGGNDDDLMPSQLVLEKQKIVINELKEKINLPLDNLNKLTNDELKQAVDNAICQIINPSKVKEQLVTQLKTQICDLERFIDFLQGEASSPGPYAQKKMAGSAFPAFNQASKSDDNKVDNKNEKKEKDKAKEAINANESTIDLLKKLLSVMQMFTLTQLGCGPRPNSFEKNTLKKATHHWGDIRANLELSINKVLRIHDNLVVAKYKQNQLKLNSTNATTESDEETLNECPNELIRAVRKDLSSSIRDLMQHGLIEIKHNSSMVPFGCFVVRSKENQNQLHVWDLLEKFFEIKHGKEFTQSTVNKLSQSFSLNVVSGRSITTKQSLLNAIETVHRIHKNDISNKDSCFKAFICLALNEKKIVSYLKQLLKTTVIIENYYQTWSYIKTTGFDDALKALDQLKVLNPNLPVDKSVRRNKLNKDVY